MDSLLASYSILGSQPLTRTTAATVDDVLSEAASLLSEDEYSSEDSCVPSHQLSDSSSIPDSEEPIPFTSYIKRQSIDYTAEFLDTVAKLQKSPVSMYPMHMPLPFDVAALSSVSPVFATPRPDLAMPTFALTALPPPPMAPVKVELPIPQEYPLSSIPVPAIKEEDEFDESSDEDDGKEFQYTDYHQDDTVKSEKRKKAGRRSTQIDPVTHLYTCKHDNCGKQFAHISNLHRHVRAIHLQERPYTCCFCNKVFSHSSNKKRHEQSCKKARTA